MAWGAPVEVMTMSALVAGVVKIFELDGLAVELLRQSDGALVGSVGNEDRSAAVSHQMPGSEFAHLAGAHDENILALQVPKIFLASSTATDAMETEDDPTAVSLRTRLATAKARVNS
jgi:hypothetical protein